MDFQDRFKYCPACGSSQFKKNNIKSKRCENCQFIYYFNPSAASVAFIRNEDGDLLVCRRAHEPEKGTLDLPGGFIDYDETAEQGVAREVKEETGVSGYPFRYLFSIPNEYHYAGLKVLTMDLFFETKIPNNQAIKACDDVDECFFIPINKLNPELFGLKSIKKAVKIYQNMHTEEQNKLFLA